MNTTATATSRPEFKLWGISAILIRPFTAFLAAKIDKKYLLLTGIAICALMTERITWPRM